MASRKHNTARRWAVVVLAVVGIASVVGLFTALGLDVDGLAGGARLVAAAAFATALVLGVGLRATHPVGSTMLLLAEPPRRPRPGTRSPPRTSSAW